MNNTVFSRADQGALATNKVLRNTYMLLSLTLVWSTAVCYIAMQMNVGRPNFILLLAGFYGFMFMAEKYRNSSLGLVFVFLFTGFVGFTLAPIVNMYYMAGLDQAILSALGGTALTFLLCSTYALTTKRDLSFLNGMLMAGFVVLLIAMVATIFFKTPMLYLTISGMFVLFSSGAILLTTQNIIRGGETNYISATISLYVSIYNLFLSLLQIFGILRDE